ncbi:MAG: hypothetical protein C4523_08795 [Myxococcales bacterium]|nr:MAG: hypothetical protein C4523_08795 [Myxococcales bacterium]
MAAAPAGVGDEMKYTVETVRIIGGHALYSPIDRRLTAGEAIQTARRAARPGEPAVIWREDNLGVVPDAEVGTDGVVSSLRHETRGYLIALGARISA